MIIHQNHNSRSNYNYNLCFYENIRFIPHFHRNFELICVTEGEVIVNVDGKDEALRRGDYALILSNQIHSFKTHAYSKCWIAVFGEEFVPKFATTVKNRQGVCSKFCPSESVSLFINTQLTECKPSIMMRKSCFYAVCDEYINKIELTDKKSSDVRVGNILDYVTEHYKEDLTLEDIAKKFGYEYHYLSRMLNNGYGIKFRELVNEYRIEAAKEVLASGEVKVTDVALECGFQSIRSFNHVFKAITGYSPKDYVKHRPTDATSNVSFISNKYAPDPIVHKGE